MVIFLFYLLNQVSAFFGLLGELPDCAGEAYFKARATRGATICHIGKSCPPPFRIRPRKLLFLNNY
jgi:hypothetical protein